MALQELGQLSRQTGDRDRFEMALTSSQQRGSAGGADRGEKDTAASSLVPVLCDRLATAREVAIALELLAVAADRDVSGVRAFVVARKGHPQPAAISGAVPHALAGGPKVATSKAAVTATASTTIAPATEPSSLRVPSTTSSVDSSRPAELEHPGGAAAGPAWHLLDDGRSIRLFEKLHTLDGLLPVILVQPPLAASLCVGAAVGVESVPSTGVAAAATAGSAADEPVTQGGALSLPGSSAAFRAPPPLPMQQVPTRHTATFNVDRRPYGEHGALLPTPDRFSSLLHLLLWRAVDDPEPSIQQAALDVFRVLANPDTFPSSHDREQFLQLVYESYTGWLCAPFTLPALAVCDQGDSARAMALLTKAWAAAEVDWEDRLRLHGRLDAGSNAATDAHALASAHPSAAAAAASSVGGAAGNSSASVGSGSSAGSGSATDAELHAAVSTAVSVTMRTMPQLTTDWALDRSRRIALRRSVMTHVRGLVMRLLQPPPRLPPSSPVAVAADNRSAPSTQTISPQQPPVPPAPATMVATTAAAPDAPLGSSSRVPAATSEPPAASQLVGFETAASKSSKMAIVDALCAFLKTHSYRIKYFVISVGLIPRVLRLTRYPDSVAQLAGLRYLKAFVMHHDEFYNRAIISKETFADAFAAVLRHHPRFNLVRSATMDLLEQLAKSGMKQLTHHVAANYKPWLLLVRLSALAFMNMCIAFRLPRAPPIASSLFLPSFHPHHPQRRCRRLRTPASRPPVPLL